MNTLKTTIKKTLAATSLALAMLVGFAQTSWADETEVTSNVTVDIREIINLAIDITDADTLVVDDSEDFGQELDITGDPTLTVQSNIDWKVQISSAGFTNGAGGTPKAISDLKYTIDGTKTDMSTTPTDIATGTPVDGDTVAIDYTVAINATDAVGVHTAIVTYTLSSNA